MRQAYDYWQDQPGNYRFLDKKKKKRSFFFFFFWCSTLGTRIEKIKKIFFNPPFFFIYFFFLEKKTKKKRLFQKTFLMPSLIIFFSYRASQPKPCFFYFFLKKKKRFDESYCSEQLCNRLLQRFFFQALERWPPCKWGFKIYWYATRRSTLFQTSNLHQTHPKNGRSDDLKLSETSIKKWF